MNDGKNGSGGEWSVSFEVNVARLPQAGMPVRFEPDAGQRAELAGEMGILAVDRLVADLVVKRWKRDGVAVDGRLRGTLVQACVVTLEPVPQEIDERIELVFVPETSKLARIPAANDGELHLDPEGADIPETFRGDTIDLGSILAELASVALDPYPRADGVEFTSLDTDPDPEGGRVSPFAALGRLNPKRP